MLSESLQTMTPTAKRLMDKLLTGKLLWMPHPNNKPQMMAYCSEADIIYYGGSAGGGKTDLIIGVAVTDQRKSIIFRREYKQLRQITDRAEEILEDTGAKYSSITARWKNIPGKRMLEFGAVQFEKDRENYKGRPHDFIGFDEIPDFTESQFRYLMAWNRSTDPGQRCRVICAGNPPTTPEGRWVINYWAPWLRKNHSNPAEYGELRWFAVLDGKDVEVENGDIINYKGEQIEPKSRTFIGARIADNPYFDGTGYKGQLQSLPEPLRSQLLNGDFFIEEQPQIRQVIPTSWIRQAQERWREDDVRGKGIYTDVGLDPSRGGEDQTVISMRTGGYFYPLVTFEGREVRDGPECVTLTQATLGEDFTGTLRIDVIGIGSSAYDIFATSTDIQVVDINFAGKSYATDITGNLHMRNIRAEAYWRLREALDPKSGLNIALPPDEELVEDLSAPTWKRTTSGILIEGKDIIRKRIGRSPGKGDAVAISYLDSTPGVLFI